MPNLKGSPQVTNQDAAIEIIKRKKGRKHLADFIRYTNPNYTFKWFHENICDKLDKFSDGHFNKLMIFVPPQHGKSELSSRSFPAFQLGKDPTTKIALCSYSQSLASGFNRNVQQRIDDPFYDNLFPKTYLNKSNVVSTSTGGELRNSEIFETVGYRGFLKTVGVGGSLTGTPVDVGIIDDPFKDRQEANSKTTRDGVWNWYVDVFCTRLHNNSKQLLLFTRWHEDDLAGRLLKRDGEISMDNLDGWLVVSFPVLKEDYSNPEDPRELGDALWPEQHSKERMIKIRDLSPTTFASLYQQRPSPAEGGMIKKEYFKIITQSEFQILLSQRNPEANIFLDTAYTEQTKNDPSAMMSTFFLDNVLYINESTSIYKEFPELIRATKDFQIKHKHNGRNAAIRIEPKASGKSLVQVLKSEGLNAIELPSPKDDKITRVANTTPFLEAYRCVLVEGYWNHSFITQCATFPNATHDDEVDNLVNAIKYYDKKNSAEPRSQLLGYARK